MNQLPTPSKSIYKYANVIVILFPPILSHKYIYIYILLAPFEKKSIGLLENSYQIHPKNVSIIYIIATKILSYTKVLQKSCIVMINVNGSIKFTSYIWSEFHWFLDVWQKRHVEMSHKISISFVLLSQRIGLECSTLLFKNGLEESSIHVDLSLILIWEWSM